MHQKVCLELIRIRLHNLKIIVWAEQQGVQGKTYAGFGNRMLAFWKYVQLEWKE